MDKFDSVFVQTVNNQADATFKCDRLTLFGKAVKLFNNISANRIIIFRFQINMKDLLVYPKDKPFSIRNILREPYFTYEYKATADLMIEMRKASVNLAIVLDEYGATAGLVTLEDLLEEIVGKIRLTQDVAD